MWARALSRRSVRLAGTGFFRAALAGRAELSDDRELRRLRFGGASRVGRAIVGSLVSPPPRRRPLPTMEVDMGRSAAAGNVRQFDREAVVVQRRRVVGATGWDDARIAGGEVCG